MASFTVNAYGCDLKQIEPSWKWVTECQDKSHGKVELWQIEQDKFGNHYVIVTRYLRNRRGCEPKVRFLKKVREA